MMQGGKGKLAVIGSCHMFSDQYIDKEDNGKILVRLDSCTSLYFAVVHRWECSRSEYSVTCVNV